jgi:hypothetical protein
MATTESTDQGGESLEALFLALVEDGEHAPEEVSKP